MRLPVDSQKASSSGRQSVIVEDDVRCCFMVFSRGVDISWKTSAADASSPMKSLRRTSVMYIQISETQTTPYMSMKALERMPVMSSSAPNMIGRDESAEPAGEADDAADGADVSDSGR